MKNNNIILTIILILLVALTWAYQGPFKTWQEDKDRPENFLSKVNLSDIDKMTIKKLDKTAVFTKVDGIWQFEGKSKFLADKTAVTAAIDILKKAQASNLELVSTSKEKQRGFELGELGTNIRLSVGNDEKISLTVGKMTSDYLGSYLSVGEDNTYLLNDINLSQTFSRTDWRDLALINVEASKINALRLQYPAKELKFEKKNEDWFLGNDKYKKEEVEKLVITLATLNAAEIPEQDFKPAKLDKPVIIAQIKGDGIDKTLMIGAKNPNGTYYAKLGDSDNIYLITSTVFDELSRDQKTLK